MKVFMTGDWHLAKRYKYGSLNSEGVDTRLIEITNTIDNMIQAAVDDPEVEMFVFLGDLFRFSMPDDELILNYVVEKFMTLWRCQHIKKIILLDGNHDVYNKSFKSVLNIFPAVTTDQKFMHIDKALAWLFPEWDLTLLCYPFDLHVPHDEVLKEFKNVPNSNVIGIGHITVAGAVTGVKNHPYTYTEDRDGAISSAALPNVKWFLGHIHKFQDHINNVVYVGSPDYVRRDEWDDPKGYVVFDTNGNKWNFIENNTKKFRTIDIDTKYDLKELTKTSYDYVTIKCTADNFTDIEKFKKKVADYNEKGTVPKILNIKYEVKPQKEQEIIVESVKENKSINDLFKESVANLHEPIKTRVIDKFNEMWSDINEKCRDQENSC